MEISPRITPSSHPTKKKTPESVWTYPNNHYYM